MKLRLWKAVVEAEYGDMSSGPYRSRKAAIKHNKDNAIVAKAFNEKHRFVLKYKRVGPWQWVMGVWE